MLFNNKRLRESDLSKSIVCYKDCGSLYLRISVKGGKDVDERAFELNVLWKELIDVETDIFTISDFTALLDRMNSSKDGLDKVVKPSDSFVIALNIEERTAFRQTIYRSMLDKKEDVLVYLMTDNRKELYKTRVITNDLMYKIEKLSDEREQEHERQKSQMKFE
jgi:hypothetical protein